MLSTAKVPLDEWVHVTGIVVDGAHQYYVNGEPGGQGGGGISLPGAADIATVLVGKHKGPREFLGMIDEVRIWNRALATDEAEAEMERGVGFLAVSAAGKLATVWAKVKM